jgi:hypothetical protein
MLGMSVCRQIGMFVSHQFYLYTDKVTNLTYKDKGKRKINPITGFDKPWDLQEVKATRF